MKKLIVALVLSAALVGCSWEEVEKNANTGAVYIEKGEQVASVLAPFTAGYGAAAAGVLSGLGNVALAIAALAANKRKKAIAKAASEAADKVAGGGQALVDASLKNGVIQDVTKAHMESRK